MPRAPRSIALLLSLLAGCAPTATESPPGGGGDPGSADDPGGGEDPGAGGDPVGGAADAGPGDPTCAAAASYSTFSQTEAEQATDGGDLYYAFYAVLDSGDPIDELEVSLWAGDGIFASAAVMPGTYTIGGPETSHADCGVCVTIYGDVDDATGDERQLYHAQSGTVVIDSITGTLSGSLANLILSEVDPSTDEVVPGGCESRIAAAAFSAPITVMP